MSEGSALAVANVLGIAILSQIFLSIEEKSLPRDTLVCGALWVKLFIFDEMDRKIWPKWLFRTTTWM
jgi:hypothetical protein